MMRACAVSSVGRAATLHVDGRGFESLTAHSPIHFALGRNRTYIKTLEESCTIHYATRAHFGYFDRVAVRRRAVNGSLDAGVFDVAGAVGLQGLELRFAGVERGDCGIELRGIECGRGRRGRIECSAQTAQNARKPEEAVCKYQRHGNKGEEKNALPVPISEHASVMRVAPVAQYLGCVPPPGTKEFHTRLVECAFVAGGQAHCRGVFNDIAMVVLWILMVFDFIGC